MTIKTSLSIPISTVLSLTLTLNLALAAGSAAAVPEAAQGAGAAHWDHTDPVHWGDLEPAYASCKLGREQSPIDIRDAKAASLPALGFNYAGSKAEVLNNGHTIQVNLAAGGSLTLASGQYQLLQFHFHTPSEEKIDGAVYPLVAHMVHKSSAGKLAVVAVLFREGKENALLAKVFAAMPAKAGDKSELGAALHPADLLPAKTGYFAFMGSLTTPPCSEGVYWQVLKTPVEMSREQLAVFRQLYPMNARPVQPVNGRTLQQSM